LGFKMIINSNPVKNQLLREKDHYPKVKLIFLLIAHIIYVSPLYAETNNQTNPMDIKIANNSNKSSTPETTSYPEFDLSLLNNKNIDYSYLNIKGNDIIPGDYLVDLIVNGTFIQLLNITFKINETKEVKACIPIEMLYIAGIKEE